MPAIARTALLLLAISALVAQTTAQNKSTVAGAVQTKRISFEITLTYDVGVFDVSRQDKYKAVVAKLAQTTAVNVDISGDPWNANAEFANKTPISIGVYTKVPQCARKKVSPLEAIPV
jgi:hypothetical protein